MSGSGSVGENFPAYIQLHRDIVVNSDLWSSELKIQGASLGFEGIIGVQGVSASNLDPAIAAGAGVNLDWAALDPLPPQRNLTTAGIPLGMVVAGYGGAPILADAIPIEFSWPLLPSTVTPGDFRLTLNTGAVVTPQFVALNPNYDFNERSTVVMFGEFANRLAPGTAGAIYPVRIDVVADDTPLMAIGPNGAISAVGLGREMGNPYAPNAGPQLVGAKLSVESPLGDGGPPALVNSTPNDGITLYGADAQFRLRLFTSGGFSLDGVSSIMPTDFTNMFRLEATNAAGNTVVISQTGVDYDMGGSLGRLRVVGMAEVGLAQAPGTTLDRAYYEEDHDNQFDIILAGASTAVARLSIVEIPTSAVAGYSDIYNPGGPGRTPQAGTIYTQPAAAQRFAITNALSDPATVSFAAQHIADYDQSADQGGVFQLIDPAAGRHIYTASSIEAQSLVDAGYQEAGVVFSNETAGGARVAIHRLRSETLSDDIYTADAAEIAALTGRAGLYVDQGVVFGGLAGPAPGAVAIHRFASAVLTDHLYTTDPANVAATYVYQGIAWYAADLRAILPAAALAQGSDAADTLLGTPWSDTLQGANGTDTLWGGAGDDLLSGGNGDDTLNGSTGTDMAAFSGELSSYRYGLRNNVMILNGSDGTDQLTDMELLKFGTQAAVSFASLKGSASDTGLVYANIGGNSGYVLPETYNGPVAGLVNQQLGGSTGDIILGTDRADFINALSGNDAINSGGGNDVIDGGQGSNFITGGAGTDKFFIDGRGAATSVTWSTITDFSAGESLTIWGYKPNVSKYNWVASDGANGFKGVTLNVDLDGNGVTDTSVTWAGLTQVQLPTQSYGSVGGQDYIFFG